MVLSFESPIGGPSEGRVATEAKVASQIKSSGVRPTSKGTRGQREPPRSRKSPLVDIQVLAFRCMSQRSRSAAYEQHEQRLPCATLLEWRGLDSPCKPSVSNISAPQGELSLLKGGLPRLGRRLNRLFGDILKISRRCSRKAEACTLSAGEGNAEASFPRGQAYA